MIHTWVHAKANVNEKGSLSFGTLPGNIIFLEVGEEAMAPGCAWLRSEGTPWCQWLVGSFLRTLLWAVLFMTHEGICPSWPICSRLLGKHQCFPCTLVLFLWRAGKGNRGSYALITLLIFSTSNSDSVCFACQCSGHMSANNPWAVSSSPWCF